MIPRVLHKYLFTGGDPVNWVDPTGRADLAETGEIDLNVSEGATAGEEATARGVSCILDTAGALLAAVSPSHELQGILVAVQINGQQCDAAAEREEAPKEVEPEPGPQENPCPPTGATRYVSEGELNVIRQTGRVPNTNRLGLPKQVFYTPEDPLQSAEAAFNAYQLPEMPSHVVTLDTSGVTNSYAGNVEGSPFNIEMVTHESIPVTCIEPLAP